MKADPILRELWQTKDALAKECGHDLRRLFELLKAGQASKANRMVNRSRCDAAATPNS